MQTKKLLIGEVINNWVVIQEIGLKNRTIHYMVKCSCGSDLIKNASQIRKAKECYKCARKRQSEGGGPRRTHGACSKDSTNYKTYMAWNYMRSRCNGKSAKSKKNYKDRGITVCSIWENSFDSFLKDMGPRPDRSSLDRINNDLGYSKENCRWATVQQQNDNKRGCLYYEHNGEKLTIARWAERWGITRSKAYEWLKREGIEWVVNHLDKIKKCSTRTTNEEYQFLGLEIRKGNGQRDHAASRNKKNPLHKMYKSWDYMKTKPPGMTKEWSDFMKFVEEMGQKPEGLRLLRKNTSKEFSKDNCYWG